VRVGIGPEEFPGYRGVRHVCTECAKRMNFGRLVIRDGRKLYRAPAGERCYTPL
jgi:hypothetical protein